LVKIYFGEEPGEEVTELKEQAQAFIPVNAILRTCQTRGRNFDVLSGACQHLRCAV